MCSVKKTKFLEFRVFVTMILNCFLLRLSGSKSYVVKIFLLLKTEPFCFVVDFFL